MDTLEQLLQRGQQAQGGGVAQSLLSASEAEHIIYQLAPLSIEEVGSSKWHTQHDWIERLNLQAHYNAQTHSDEFVVELLVSLDKLQVLVHDLLVIEAWKEHVYPLLAGHLAERVDSVTTYLLLYHEVTVANLLQVALYHSHAAESLSEDYALEVADWCYRKLTRLNVEGHALAEHRERSAEELLRQTRLEEQEEKRREVEFSVLMCSLAILRYVTDALPRMPMGALGRVVSTNDTLMGLLPLLDRPPWVRTRVPSAGPGGKGGRPVLEKWAGNRWAPVAPADRLKITQTDGQVWLAVTNLLVEPRCRSKYSLDEFRRERILGLKRHLNELMFDQLPVLKDLQRVLDELALGVLPDQSGGKGAALILEAVPVIREQLLRGRNWRHVAERARQDHFGRDAARLARERLEAMVKHLDFLCEMEPQPAADGQGQGTANGGSSAAAAEPHPPVKVSTWRKAHDSGVFESWYDFAMEVDDSRPPEPVEVAAPAAGGSATTSGSGSSSKAGGSGAAAAAVVHGLRYRLRPLDVDSTRPLPANGKASVRWGNLAAEALLQLPELPTRGSEEGAAVLWVTVGLLAMDGLVLQVKLKKAPKPKERDRVAGVWYAYHPVAGALTVLRQEAQQPPASSAAPNKAGAAIDAVGRVQTRTPGGSGTGSGSAGSKEKVEANKGAAAAQPPLVQVLPEASKPVATATPAAAVAAVEAVRSAAATASGAGPGGVSAGSTSNGGGTSAPSSQQQPERQRPEEGPARNTAASSSAAQAEATAPQPSSSMPPPAAVSASPPQPPAEPTVSSPVLKAVEATASRQSVSAPLVKEAPATATAILTGKSAAASVAVHAEPLRESVLAVAVDAGDDEDGPGLDDPE